MFLVCTVAILLLLSILLYKYFGENHYTKGKVATVASSLILGVTLLILVVIIIAVHTPSRNESYKREDMLRKTTLENRLSSIDDDDLSEDELRYYYGTVRNIHEFNNELTSKQRMSNSEWLSWLVEPYVNEIQPIQLELYACYRQYGEEK